jgi:hypothetical protein
MEMPVKRRRFGVVASALAAYGFTTAVISGPALAGLCPSTTDCTLTLDAGNSGSGFGTGDFGRFIWS